MTGSTGSETITGSANNETYVVSATNQVSAGDTYDGGGGTDTLQIGTAAAGTAIDLSAAATDGVKGFLNIEKIAFVNTSGTSTATFSSGQLGAGLISDTATITGNAQINALAFNVVAGGSLDLSKFTYATWTSGTDTITATGSTGSETITGSANNETYVVSSTSQVSVGDKYDGGGGTDTLQIGTAAAGTAIDLSAAATDGVSGFLSIEKIAFVNTSGTSTATFSSAQFGAGLISTSLAVTGTAFTTAIVVNAQSGATFDMSAWTFTTWTAGTDTITLVGSTGTESITGSSQNDVFAVDAGQIQSGDVYDGGGGTDTILIGPVSGGTSVDLSAASFLNTEAITFANTSGTESATFGTAQFGAGKISSSATITAAAGVQQLTFNVASGTTFDLSTFTFTSWAVGTDTITVTGTSGNETITGSTATVSIDAGGGGDTLIVAATNQVSVGDRYDGGAGTDTLQIGVAGAGTAIDLSAAANNGVDGFLNIEQISFTNTSGTSTATFNAAQFGTGKISTSVAITGTGSTNALAINFTAGGSIDMSGWTFGTWTVGSDTITITGSTGSETIVGSSADETYVVGATNQVSVGDRYDGGGGTDTLQIGVAGAGTAIDLSAAASNGVNGFLNIEQINFTNTSGTSTATFNAAQFGTGKISASVAITGTGSTNALAINFTAGGSIDLSGWTFNSWTSGTDTITVTGSTGSETIVGSSADETYVVSATNQVSAGDTYDGGGGTDTLQIGTAAAGTAIDLSAAATDGVKGFLNIEKIAFVNTSGTSTATFSSAQFGAGRILDTATITGNAQINALAFNVVAGGSLDLSKFTYATWTSGTDTLTVTGSTGSETITGSANNETYVVSATNQVSAGDTYDGGGGTDTLQIGTAAAGTAIDLSAAATDGVKGFLNIEKIAFVNTSGTSTATFSSAQFGAGRILDTATITGNAQINALAFNVVAGGSLDLSKFTYATWTSGTDTLTVTGSTGSETITGSANNETYVVSNTNQVSAGDTYDGGGGTDTLQIGTAAAGTAIDLSAAATDGVSGFLSIEKIAFVNTSGTSTATFSSAQFGAGLISDTATITGNAQINALTFNVVAGGSLDLSKFTYATWTSGTDTLTATGSTGSETITGSANNETYVVSGTSQVSVGDKYDGGGGTDTLQIGTAAAGTAIDLSAAATDGVSGFLSIEKIAFVNTSGTSTATFSSAQFGAGLISSSVAVTGTAFATAIVVNVQSGTTFDMSSWTFSAWTASDTITVTGSTGNETIIGSSQNDIFVVSNTNQVAAGDRYDGRSGTDTLQVDVAGAGTSIVLSGAASDGVDGFINIEALTFASTSGASTATFSSAQFGAGKISNSLAVTGSGADNSIAIDMVSGGTLDLSAWSFATWAAADAITVTGTTGNETITGATQAVTIDAGGGDDTLIVTATGQVQAADRYDGGLGTDTLQIGLAGAGVTVDLSGAASDGVNGFLNIEALTFTNTSGTSTATFSAAQFGSGRISTAAAVTGTGSTNALVINLTTDGTLDLAGWTFNTWTSGTDTITVTGSTGSEQITGSSVIDRFVVVDSSQVSAGDKYDGGAANDILQVGVAGAGSSIDFSGAAADGVNGFLSIEALAFTNTLGTSTATFSSAQFGAGKLSTALAVTGTGSANAIAINMLSGGSLDLSAWTFATWIAGTNTITVTGTGGNETITGATQVASIDAGDGNDTLIVTATGQVQATDKYDGGLGIDTLQIGADAAGVTVDLSGAASDGVNGFLGIEVIAFANTSGTSTATFSADQFGSGKISSSVSVTGTASTNAIVVNVAAGGSFDMSSWTFATWSATDTVAINGSTGNETITGSGKTDLIVGAAGADTLLGGAGLDVFGFNPGDTALSFGGAGTSGTVSGYDTVSDFTVGTTVSAAEKLGFIGANVGADTASSAGAASTLLLHTGAAVQSHSITGGLITFDDAGAFAGAVTIDTAGDLAAVAEYLQGTDLGDAGTSVAFQAILGGVGRTFVWIQGNDAAGTSNVLVDLVNVSGSSLSAASDLISVLDNAAPNAPTISAISENGAGGLNVTETSDGTPVDVSLAGTGALAGDTLDVLWGSQTVTYTLLQSDINAGTVTLTVSQAKIAAQGDGTFDVTATLTNQIGNVSTASAPFTVTVDTVTPGTPTVDTIAENGAGGISFSEASNGTPVVVGLAGTNGVAGDTVMVTWGSQTVSYTLLAADIVAGNATVTVPQAMIAAQGDGTFDVTAKVTDIAGNVGVSSSAFPVHVDTVVPAAPAISSVAENASGGINAAEAADGTPVVVSLSGTGAVAGDTVTVSWGSQSIDYTLLAADVLAASATVDVSPAKIAAQGDGTFGVTTTITDSAGNTSPDSSSFSVTVDTVTPGTPTITSISENSAGGINAAEAANGTPVVVSLAGTGAVAGDTLAVTWGSQTVDYTLLAADIIGGSATVSVPQAKIAAQGDGTFIVSTKLTDVAGNVGSASSIVSIIVDTVAPNTPGITAIPEDSAGGINTAEASDGTPVIVSLSGTNAVAGDTLTIDWGSQTTTYTLLAADILGGSATVTVPPATIAAQGDGTFNVSAKITDIAGNVGATSSSVSATVDTVAPGAPAITAIAENGAGGINAAEAADGTLVVVSLAGTGASAGDTVKIHWGSQTVTYTLQTADINGDSATVIVPQATIVAQGDGTFNATAQITDIALTTGPSSPGVSVTVDTATPGVPSIISIAENGAGGINAAEAANGTPVVVSLAGTSAVAGDTITIDWGGQEVTYTLLASDISGDSATVTILPDTIATQGNGAFNVSAKLTDIAGNATANSAFSQSRSTPSRPARPGSPRSPRAAPAASMRWKRQTAHPSS
ncbi:MAG: hypothetical protein U1E60_00685 [Reyranellaceae bacterium]